MAKKIIEDEENNVILMEDYIKKESDKEDDESEDFYEEVKVEEMTDEEIIARNAYVEKDVASKLKDEGLAYNKMQLYRNGALFASIVGIVIEIIELSTGKTSAIYKFILPAAIVLAIIVFIVNFVKFKKASANIRYNYNKTYQDICLEHLKFKVEKGRYSDISKETIYKNEEKDVSIRSYSEDDKKYTKILFGDKSDFFNIDFSSIKSITLSSGDVYHFSEIKGEDQKGLLIKDYCYGEGMKTFFERYSFKDISKFAIEENIVLNSIYDHLLMKIS